MILLAATLVAGAAPAQAAQSSLSLSIPAPDPIEPGTTVDVPVTVRYSYSGSGSSDGTVDVTFEVTTQDPVSARVQPRVLTIQVDDEEQSGQGTAQLRLTMDEDAEAFEEVFVQVTARAEESGDVESSSADRMVAVQATYVPGFALEAVDREVEVGERSLARVRLKGTNQGNGPVQVLLEAVSVANWVDVGLPTTTVVSHVDGANSTTLTVRVLPLQDTAGDRGEVELRARYWYQFADSSTALNTGTVQIVVHWAENPVPVVAGIAIIGAAAAILVYWFKFR